MLKRMLMLCAGGTAVAAVAVSAAAAMPAVSGPQVTTAFLCYSKYETNPGVWPLSVTNSARQSAGELQQLGYWSPFAERAVPTATRLGNGWYLDCNLPATLKPASSGKLMGLAGTMFSPPGLAGEAGYYPVATAATPAA